MDKYRGEKKYQNKKKNMGRRGQGRSDGNSNQRGKTRLHDRYSHHSRRRVLDEGISRGAEEDWLPSTTCKQKHKNWEPVFNGFNKWRYRGDICKFLEKNNRTSEENKIIKELFEQYPQMEKQINCRRCRYYYQMLSELPNLESVDEIQDVKEMYRNRNLKSKHS